MTVPDFDNSCSIWLHFQHNGKYACEKDFPFFEVNRQQAHKWTEQKKKGGGASQTPGPDCHSYDPALQFQTRTMARNIKKLLY